MRRTLRNVGYPAALVACCILIGLTSPAIAQEESLLKVEGPVMTDPSAMPTLPGPAAESAMPTMPPPAGASSMPTLPAPVEATPPGIAPAPTPPEAKPATAVRSDIDYRTHLAARRMLRRTDEMRLVMTTENPIDRCLYDIPLCIPTCCTGQPRVTSDCGPFGRGVVTYCWPCGFEAKVVFTARGDVVVNYRG
jgi:hypothetical protein